MSVLYFPYLPALNRDQQQLRQDFTADTHLIASTLADLNGSNPVDRGEPPPIGKPPCTATRPTLADLTLRLGVSHAEAEDMLRGWDEANEQWEHVIRPLYERLPHCLCHNDVSPGNTIHSESVTTYTDFGLASIGPVGSDLHTVLRWLGRTAENRDSTQGVIDAYTASIRRHNGAVSVDDVLLAAWGSYFLRYTNLKYRSARYIYVMKLALSNIARLAKIHSAATS